MLSRPHGGDVLIVSGVEENLDPRELGHVAAHAVAAHAGRQAILLGTFLGLVTLLTRALDRTRISFCLSRSPHVLKQSHVAEASRDGLA